MAWSGTIHTPHKTEQSLSMDESQKLKSQHQTRAPHQIQECHYILFSKTNSPSLEETVVDR